MRVSVHGYEDLAADHVLVRDVVNGLATAVMVEDYPDYAKGPCVLVLEQEADMSTKATKKLVREGDFVAEVDVTLIEAEGGWTPSLSLDDAYRLDDVREALRAGDVKRASRRASRVYRLTPVA